MEVNILNTCLSSQSDQSTTIAWFFSALIHIGLAAPFLFIWKTAVPPMISPDLLSVEVIMESPSPGGADGLQQQMQMAQPTSVPVTETIVEPVENVEISNEKTPIIQDVPHSPFSDIVLKQKPNPPVQKKQSVTNEKSPPSQNIATALANIKGHPNAETLNGTNQRAGIQKAGFGGQVQSAQYQLGSATNPKPQYPKLARKKGWQGRVILRVHVDENGHPVDVQIAHSSGYKILDRAALKTIRKWTFQPARKAGFHVASTVHIPIRFDLMSS